MARIIMHLDMDAFFASVEERENPKLRGRPIVIGADPKGGSGRGVVSTASYAARKFGIHSAVPISTAWKLCPAPTCTYLPVDMKLYEIVSERIMQLICEVVQKQCHSERSRSVVKNPVPLRAGSFGSPGSPQDDIVVEQVSIDEAFVDVSFCESFEAAEELARAIKNEIKKCERLSCSVGIGPNKLIAKIASDFQKPDGLTLVRANEAADFLASMPVRKLPGIGPKMEMLLSRKGIKTIADLRVSLPRADDLFERAWGIDNSPVLAEYAIKSLGHETTFDQDTRNQAALTKTALALCEEVLREARKGGITFRTISLRVRFDNFETHTSSHTLPVYTNDGTILSQEVLKLLFPYFKNKGLIRLLGVRISNLNLKEVKT